MNALHAPSAARFLPGERVIVALDSANHPGTVLTQPRTLSGRPGFVIVHLDDLANPRQFVRVDRRAARLRDRHPYSCRACDGCGQPLRWTPGPRPEKPAWTWRHAPPATSPACPAPRALLYAAPLAGGGHCV